MILFLLDAGGALIAIPIFAFVFMLAAILVEGFVIAAFKIKTLKGAMIDSLLMNLVSYILGLVLFTGLLLEPSPVFSRDPADAGACIYPYAYC